MSYALVVDYLPSEALKDIDKSKALKTFNDYRSLKSAMHSLMNLDLREFSSEIVLKENLPRHLIAAAIIDSKFQVVATVRMLEQFENIKMPKGIYLHIHKPSISVEDFERKSDFPVAAYAAHGPRNDYFLLRAKADLVTGHKHETIKRRHKAKQEVKPGPDISRKI